MKAFYIFILLFLCGAALSISYSQQWFEDTSGVNVQLNSVVCLSYYRAWCCGNSGTVLKIKPSFTYYGRWTNVSGNGIPSGIDLMSIVSPMNDSNIALTTGTTGGITYVYRTSNSGANWIQVFS